LRLGKSNAMLAHIIAAFCIVPFEPELCHNYSVGMA
jgi:hypothetical protein